MTIYIDNKNRCHLADDGTMTAVETDFFNGKCQTFVEGYKYDTKKRMIAPWQDYTVLAAAQAQYEAMLAEQQDMQTALESLGVNPNG